LEHRNNLNQAAHTRLPNQFRVIVHKDFTAIDNPAVSLDLFNGSGPFYGLQQLNDVCQVWPNAPAICIHANIISKA